jgi:cytochrome c5
MIATNRLRAQRGASFIHLASYLFMAVLALVPAVIPELARAESNERGGKEVVDAVCNACHGTGANGAPKIGDKKAWSRRASQGLTSLTQNALKGIRQMPPHGGSPGLTDLDIENAITYMVNQSGGHWTEPVNKASPGAERTGEQVVSAQCNKCHEGGVGGAPRNGDRAAWIPRFKQGLDPLVRSAINGHGGMPPRGGMASLTDAELRGAIVYMLNGGTAPAKTGAVAKEVAGQNFKVIESMTIYLGIISADAIRDNPGKYPRSVYGVPPQAPEQYYVSVSLFDANDGQRLADAAVRARVTTATGAGPEKPLVLATVPNALVYGTYFSMGGTGPYQISLQIRRPGMADSIRTQFEYAH